MSVPEEVANDLEIHIRRLLAARKLDQRPIKSQNDSKSTLDVHSEESKPRKMVTDDSVVKEETIGILYAENKFEKVSRRDSVPKMSLSGSPINMSSIRLKNGYNHDKAIVVNSGTAQPPKTEKSGFRFSYTHAQKSGSNVAEPSIFSNDRDTLKEGASNFRISLNIYKNKQNIEKRHRVEEAKTFKACLHPRVVMNEKSPLRSEHSRYRDNRQMPSRLGDWYWKRLEEIERHRCPPPPNSPVPREWNEADM
ncbi:hypothetical protein BSL78_15455 [Apostichopus japonicus]|uniref:Uncharacterized protein n=1 Tax=Stichopus japonicus TaxID=307972 RepID=A0A2G8KI52_STIJA|nr:hypothetical protein BSL78_15455 [Apostichopus japonicus]